MGLPRHVWSVHTDTDTDTHRHTQTHRHTDTQTHRHTHTHTHTHQTCTGQSQRSVGRSVDEHDSSPNKTICQICHQKTPANSVVGTVRSLSVTVLNPPQLVLTLVSSVENIYVFASYQKTGSSNLYDGSLISPRTGTTFFSVQACQNVRVSLGRSPLVSHAAYLAIQDRTTLWVRWSFHLAKPMFQAKVSLPPHWVICTLAILFCPGPKSLRRTRDFAEFYQTLQYGME